MGIQAKLSWLSPKTVPFFSATPTTLKGRPSRRTSRPMGSRVPKKASTRSVPMTATGAGLVDVGLDEVTARGQVAHAADPAGCSR